MKKIIKYIIVLSLVLIAIPSKEVGVVNAATIIIDVDAIAPDGKLSIGEYSITGSLGSVDYIITDGVDFRYSGSMLELTVEDSKIVRFSSLASNTNTTLMNSHGKLTIVGNSDIGLFIDGNLTVNCELEVEADQIGALINGDAIINKHSIFQLDTIDVADVTVPKTRGGLIVNGKLSANESFVEIYDYSLSYPTVNSTALLYVKNSISLTNNSTFRVANTYVYENNNLYLIYIEDGDFDIIDSTIELSSYERYNIYFAGDGDVNFVNSYVTIDSRESIITHLGSVGDLNIDNSSVIAQTVGPPGHGIFVPGDVVIKNGSSLLCLLTVDVTTSLKTESCLNSNSVTVDSAGDEYLEQIYAPNYDPLIFTSAENPGIDLKFIKDFTKYNVEYYQQSEVVESQVVSPNYIKSINGGNGTIIMTIDNISEDTQSEIIGEGRYMLLFNIHIDPYSITQFAVYDSKVDSYVLEKQVFYDQDYFSDGSNTLVPPEIPKNPGYISTGWSSTQSFSGVPPLLSDPTGVSTNYVDDIYIATYKEVPPVTANFYSFDSTTNSYIILEDSQAVLYDDTAVLPTNPSDLSNYTFKGWTTLDLSLQTTPSVDVEESLATINTDTNYYAVYTKIPPSTINFYSFDSTTNTYSVVENTQQVEKGDLAVVPTNPSDLDWYTFKGWTTSDLSGELMPSTLASTPFFPVTSDTNYYAVYDTKPVVTASFYIFDEQTNTYSTLYEQQTVVADTTSKLPLAPSDLVNYRFVGWTTNDLSQVIVPDTSTEEAFQNISSDTVYYAVYEKLVPVIATFYSFNTQTNSYSNVENSQVVLSGGKPVIPDNAKDLLGYKFSGWTTVDLSAASLPDTSLNETIDNITTDTNYYAVYTPVEVYTATFISFDMQTKSYSKVENSLQVNQSSIIDVPSALDLNGYTFIGWTTNDLSGESTPSLLDFTQITSIEANITYYAVYRSGNEYSSITLNYNGADAIISPSTLVSRMVVIPDVPTAIHNLLPGDILYELPTPIKNGYRFTGWYANPQLTGKVYTNSDKFDGEVQKSKHLYAGWKKDVVLSPTGTINYFALSIIIALLLYFIRKFSFNK